MSAQMHAAKLAVVSLTELLCVLRGLFRHKLFANATLCTAIPDLGPLSLQVALPSYGHIQVPHGPQSIGNIAHCRRSTVGDKCLSSRRVWGSYAELCSDRADIRSMTVSHHPIDNAQQQ